MDTGVCNLGICEACSDDSQCGGSKDLCSREKLGASCVPPCDATDQCPNGFFCAANHRGGKSCYPKDGKCIAPCKKVTCQGGQHCDPFTGTCRGTGPCEKKSCSPGQFCHPATGECAKEQALCEPCRLGVECGVGNLCLTIADGRYCGRDCSAAPCPGGYRCVEFPGGVQQCVPRAGRCAG